MYLLPLNSINVLIEKFELTKHIDNTLIHFALFKSNVLLIHVHVPLSNN